MSDLNDTATVPSSPQSGNVVMFGDERRKLQDGGVKMSTLATTTYVDNHTKWSSVKPEGGVPKTDLASGVQASLDKADSAVQPSELFSSGTTVVDSSHLPSPVAPSSDESAAGKPADARATGEALDVKRDKGDLSVYSYAPWTDGMGQMAWDDSVGRWIGVGDTSSMTTGYQLRYANGIWTLTYGSDYNPHSVAAPEDVLFLTFPGLVTYTRTSVYAATSDTLARTTDFSGYATQEYVKDVLNYKPIAVNTFTVSPATAELGSTVANVTLTYALNKAAAAATLDGAEVTLSGASGTISLTGLSLTANKTWALKVTEAESPAADEPAQASKSATLSFLNRVYWGAKAAPAQIDSAFILGLGNSELSGSRARTKTVTAGAGQYIWFAYPARLGAATFKVGGFDGGFTLVSDSFSHTNASGYAEAYRVYRSDNAGLGATTVVVS